MTNDESSTSYYEDRLDSEGLTRCEQAIDPSSNTELDFVSIDHRARIGQELQGKCSCIKLRA
jgi:hypothetical protein